MNGDWRDPEVREALVADLYEAGFLHYATTCTVSEISERHEVPATVINEVLKTERAKERRPKPSPLLDRDLERLLELGQAAVKGLGPCLRENDGALLLKILPSPCQHNWVDPSNEHLESGPFRLCTLCKLYAVPE